MDYMVATYLRWRNGLPDLRAMPTEDAWYAFRGAHKDRCALCRTESDRLLIDHDHTSGLVRGLLCRSCNGVTPSDARHVNRAKLPRMPHVVLLYTQWPPSAVAGIRERYYSPRVIDPAPRRHEILWHAYPDGLEHDRERRRDAMEDAISRLTVVEW